MFGGLCVELEWRDLRFVGGKRADRDRDKNRERKSSSQSPAVRVLID